MLSKTKLHVRGKSGFYIVKNAIGNKNFLIKSEKPQMWLFTQISMCKKTML